MRMPLLVAIPFLMMTPDSSIQAGLYDGRPVFSEGTELGYFIWREGDTWHVCWTTVGRMRVFAGTVTAVGGNLKSLKRIDVETERKVVYPGRAPRVVVGPRGRARVRGGRAPVVATREQDHIEMSGDDQIVFNARTDNDIDGFNFKVGDRVDRLRFNLRIDGREIPGVVEVGRNNHKPAEIPIVVTLR